MLDDLLTIMHAFEYVHLPLMMEFSGPEDVRPQSNGLP